METVKEYLPPEALAVLIVLVGAVVLLVARNVSAKVADVTSAIDELKPGLERLVNARIAEMGNTLTQGIDRRFADIDKQMLMVADTNRDTLSKSISEIAREIGDFKNDQIKANAQSHEALQNQFVEQALHLQERVHAVAKENAEAFNMLQERIRAIVSSGLADTHSDMVKRLAQLSEDMGKVLDSMVESVGAQLNRRFETANTSIENLTGRLDAIDGAQKRIEALSSDVTNLTRVVADKRARGVVGEIQLAHLVDDMLSRDHYETDVTLPNGAKAPLLLKLPEPTGNVAVCTDLPLESLGKAGEPGAGDEEVEQARKRFAADLLEAVEQTAKRIDPPRTANGAVLFVPAESAFAEIHAHHRGLVEEAFRRNVWIVSPTTMMALLNMARAVIKDVATRRETRRIRDELARFGDEFGQLNRLIDSLVANIGQANRDVLKARNEGRQISEHLAHVGETADLRLPGTDDASGEPPQGG